MCGEIRQLAVRLFYTGCAFFRAEDDRVEDGQNEHRENGGHDQSRDDRDRHGDEERV